MRSRIRLPAPALLVGLVLVAACGRTLPTAQADGTDPMVPTAPGAAARPTPRPGATADPSPAPEAAALTVDRHRHHADVASGGQHAPYNYAPSVMADDGTYRMWWCSQLPGVGPSGDDILYGTAGSLQRPFHGAGGGSATPVFHGSSDGFDSVHTCDPSVLRVHGTYYLYYTGSTGEQDHGNSIGVATSEDGVHFTRVGKGRPIVTPAEDTHRDNGYGVGQPSVVFLDGWYYLMFTDTTGKGAGWNGAGQFVVRASNPTFTTNVQVLSDSGFSDADSTMAVRERAVVDAFSADWMWVDALDAFAIAHETSAGTTITFWDKDFTHNPYRPIEIGGAWQEGPGLVRSPQGHAPASGSDPCGRVPFDVVRATRNASSPTGLSEFGLDVHGVRGCRGQEQALALLGGFALPSPRRTMDIVSDGKVVEVERRSVAEKLAKAVLDKPVAGLRRAHPAMTIRPGVPALRAPGRPLALLLPDGRVCAIGSAAAAKANGSTIKDVTDAEWDSHPLGADLSSLRG